MKRKLKVTLGDRTLEGEVNVPNKMHLDAQIRFPARVHRDRTKYTRKIKHKIRYE